MTHQKNRQNRAYLIDFDNTLLNTDAIKFYWLSLLQKKNPKVSRKNFLEFYKKSKSPEGFLNTKIFGKLLKVDQSFFNRTPFKKFLFPKSLETIRRLKRMGKVLIFSLGDLSYQKEKIWKSGVKKVIEAKDIIIVQDKKKGLLDLVSNLKKQGYGDFAFIDDMAKQLVEAHKISREIVTVWVRFGKYKNIPPLLKSSINFEVDTISEAGDFLQTIISSFPSTVLKQRLSVVKGIGKNQILNLISYTKRDKKVRSLTHDTERFKNLKSFAAWKKRKKIIYSMINSKGKLMGIIWFAKKPIPGFPYTFAVRTYPPARGKGLATKFVNQVLQDFAQKRSGGIWLETAKQNKVAINFYKKLGFKQIPTDKIGAVIMTRRLPISQN